MRESNPQSGGLMPDVLVSTLEYLRKRPDKLLLKGLWKGNPSTSAQAVVIVGGRTALPPRGSRSSWPIALRLGSDHVRAPRGGKWEFR